MPLATADATARRFLECCGERALFVTNGSLATHDVHAREWSPLANATFDTGVIGVSAGRVGLLWVEDED